MMSKINLEANYLNIHKKTGKTPSDFKKVAKIHGFVEGDFLKQSIKAATIIAWLKKDYGLGHGHALAIFHYLEQGTV